MSDLRFAFLVGVCLIVLVIWAALEPIGDPRQHQSIATPPVYRGVR